MTAKGAFRAFDPATGAEKWTLPGHGPGYASPVVARLRRAVRQLITMTDKAVVGVEVDDGKLLWQIPFPDEWNENIVTPVVAGGPPDRLRHSQGHVRLSHREARRRARADPGLAQRRPADVYELAGRRRRFPLRILEQAEGTAVLPRREDRRGEVDDRRPRPGPTRRCRSPARTCVVLTTEGELIVVRKDPGEVRGAAALQGGRQPDLGAAGADRARPRHPRRHRREPLVAPLDNRCRGTGHN